jgi:hypothetical protein
MKFSRYDRPYDEYAKWQRICSEGTWATTEPSAFSGLIPDSLLSKTNSVFVMASGSPLASVFVANLNRVDKPPSAIDQEPYILAFDHSASAASGGFVHHGNWQSRTTFPGKGFFDAIAASGIRAHYPLQEMPTTASGYINDLAVDSQKAAFWTALSALRNDDE